MQAFFAPSDHRHAPEAIHCRGTTQTFPESPQRPARLVEGLHRLGISPVVPQEFGMEAIHQVHDRDYLAFLQTAHADWQEMRRSGVSAGEIVEASGFSLRHRYARVPDLVSVKADYYLSGGWAPIDRGTFAAARASCDSALAGAEHLISGAPEAYALCRPPGHHAYADLAGGYCYLNNAAVAAQYLAERVGRVSILDIDAHHGNGTQGIFYDRGDVQFVSVHADPARVFPFYCGFADETGRGAGEGYTVNLPLPVGSDDEAFLSALNIGLAAVEDFSPEMLVVSLGLDISDRDATRLMTVTKQGFSRVGESLGRFRKPVLLVQEGGYGLDHLADDLEAFLTGFLGSR